MTRKTQNNIHRILRMSFSEFSAAEGEFSEFSVVCVISVRSLNQGYFSIAVSLSLDQGECGGYGRLLARGVFDE